MDISVNAIKPRTFHAGVRRRQGPRNPCARPAIAPGDCPETPEGPMHAQITVHASPERLFAWLSEPGNARFWFAHLQHDADRVPDPGLSADAAARTLRWTAAPAGSMAVSGAGRAAALSLTFDEAAHAPEPAAEEESPDDGPTNAGNALRSIKSHVEAAEGGDPDLHLPGVVSKEAVAEAEREIAADPGHSGTPRR